MQVALASLATFRNMVPRAQCTDNEECSEGEFCRKADGDCDGNGSCEVTPLVCPVNFNPVCGCDGQTYTNACEAHKAGVSIASLTACQNSCTSNADCTFNQLCRKAEGDCDGEGECENRPPACTEQFDPVCGCDGQTYDNECKAREAGVSISSQGVCSNTCRDNAGCAATDFCNKATGDCDGNGTCETLPPACTRVFDPVCGCDDRQYDNGLSRQ